MLRFGNGPLINGEETTVQVLYEPNRKNTSKSYMWVFRGGAPKKPVVIFQYNQSRQGSVARDFLGIIKALFKLMAMRGMIFSATKRMFCMSAVGLMPDASLLRVNL